MQIKNIFQFFPFKESLLAILIISSFVSHAQDIHFSQFYETPLSRNPALAGIFTGNLRVQAIHRDQWTSVEVPFKTSLISIEYKMHIGDNDDYITTGTSGFKDLAGNNMLTTSNLQQSLTYHKSLDNNINRYLSIGFSTGYSSRRIDPTILTFDNQYGTNGFDAALPSGETFRDVRRNNFELTTGISYNSSVGERGNFFVGGSAWYLLKDQSNFLSNSITQTRKWQCNAGIRTFISSELQVHLESNIYFQSTSKEVMVGGLLTYFNSGFENNQRNGSQLSLGAGAFVRLNDAIIPVIRAGFKNIFIAYSYDLNTSKLKTSSQGRGGSEMSLSYIFNKLPDSYKQQRCPRF